MAVLSNLPWKPPVPTMKQQQQPLPSRSCTPSSRRRPRQPRTEVARRTKTPVLLLSALLMLQSTVYSQEQIPAPGNTYPTRKEELMMNQQDSSNLAPQPKRPQDDAKQRDNATPSHLVNTLPNKNNNNNNKSAGLYPISSSEKRLYREFMDWCKQVLGIQTILEIQTFDYNDYMRALPSQDWDDDTDDDSLRPPLVESFKTIPVRGLAATRDIERGETMIRIPLQALLSVATTIDHDPILGRVMGPEARRNHGWHDDIDILETPLLAVALLHHKRLGAASPLSPYLRVLALTPTDSFPFLWSHAKLKSTVSEGIRTVARGIKREIKDMYAAVVQVLIEEHPDVFGNVTTNSKEGTSSSDSQDDSSKSSSSTKRRKEKQQDEWMFSFEHFQWAFAIINSRHWQLPIPDLNADRLAVNKPPRREVQSEDEQLPPADMPTDYWIQEQMVEGDGKPKTVLHSFLAPVADMLNFGPPCTRGHYDEATHTFEIIASCSFRKGQEVTFWYSNECDHVMVGVYGFTHPLVPKCPTAEEYRRRSEEWEARAKELEEQVTTRNQLVKQLDEEVVFYQDVLEGCTCCRYEKRVIKTVDDPPSLLRHEHVRGGHNGVDEAGRRRIRKKIRDEEEGDEF